MYRKIFMIASMALLILSACRSDYEKMVLREKESGIRHDSLFLGLYFGMNRKDFYAHCWELNKQGLIRQGGDNSTVLYELKDELAYPAQMDFYPKFHEDKIYEMPVTFTYEAWAPWNKHMFADSLKLDLLDFLEEWYGEGFIPVEHPQKKNIKAHVKIDGNRRIFVISEVDDKSVKVTFTDLKARKEVDMQTKK